MLKCLTPSQAATLTTLSTATIYRLLESGEMPAARIRGRWIILPDELEKWLKSNQQQRSSGRGIALVGN